jgi:uncharacterized protein YbaR (Trm112 family)
MGVARSLSANGSALIREIVRIPRETRRLRPRPPHTGLVLEVGGGQRPHPRSDVVVDKYVADDFERAGGAALDLTRPLVVADGHGLPFADRSMDYVIAAHVLEHATDPRRFAGELSRVAPAGYVELPSRAAELTFEWPFHPWLVDRRDDTLLFSPKDTHAPCGRMFHDSFERSPLFRLWWAAHRSRWLHGVHWEERLTVETTGESRAEQTATFDLERTAAALRQLAGHGSLPAPDPRVAAALRCPVCRSELERGRSRLVCRGCGRSYPVEAGVPVLVEEASA